MILTITDVKQEFTKGGAEARKITGTRDDGSETTKWVFDNLKMAWPLLKEGNRVELKMVKKGQYWNITNIKLADDEWTEEINTVKPEEVAEPVAEVLKGGDEPIDKIERSMWFKEVGELYRASKLDKDNPIHQDLKKLYFNRMFRAVGISAKL